MYLPRTVYLSRCSKSWRLKRISDAPPRRSLVSARRPAECGLIVDIDGVIVRGNRLIEGSREAFHEFLTDGDGEFLLPTVFLTNGGNALRAQKAKSLSSLLGIEIVENQVILAHSPLKSMKSYHDKHVLVCGQGPLEEIALKLGFSQICTIEMIREAFPLLDVVDAKRRAAASSSNPSLEARFPPVEAVVLMGDPIRWETHLQIILDLLLTNGYPSGPLSAIPYPHIPVLACNADLLWAATAPLPRIGHGSFLYVLEALYCKVTGRHLRYDALLGKPSPLTYRHAEAVLGDECRRLFGSDGASSLRTLYGIGDNPDTDVCGANVYGAALAEGEGLPGGGASDCVSILVKTGVFDPEESKDDPGRESRHQHPLFAKFAGLTRPDLLVDNFYEAVKAIVERERVSRKEL